MAPTGQRVRMMAHCISGHPAAWIKCSKALRNALGSSSIATLGMHIFGRPYGPSPFVAAPTGPSFTAWVTSSKSCCTRAAISWSNMVLLLLGNMLQDSLVLLQMLPLLCDYHDLSGLWRQGLRARILHQMLSLLVAHFHIVPLGGGGG